MTRIVQWACLFSAALLLFPLWPGSSSCYKDAGGSSCFSCSGANGPRIIIDTQGRTIEHVAWTLARKRGGSGGENLGNGPQGNDRYKRWESLSPERKRLLRERMEEWERLSPEQRELMRKRYEQWKRLSPEEQRRIRNQLRRWDELTPEERQRIRERFVQ